MNETNHKRPEIKYQTSPKVDALINALCRAKLQMTSLVRENRDSQTKNMKQAYTYSWADLTQINAVTVKPLAACDLVFLFLPEVQENGRALLNGRLYHSSGQWISGELELNVTQQTSQAYGSALSYDRRYLKLAILDLAPYGEDDDGVLALEEEIGKTILENVIENNSGNTKETDQQGTSESEAA